MLPTQVLQRQGESTDKSAGGRKTCFCDNLLMFATKKNEGVLELGEDLWPVIGILMTISCQVYGRNTIAVISNEYRYFYSYTVSESSCGPKNIETAEVF